MKKIVTASLALATLALLLVVTALPVQADGSEETTQTERVCTTGAYGQETCTEREVITREDGNVVVVPELENTALDAKTTLAIASVLTLGGAAFLLKTKIA